MKYDHLGEAIYDQKGTTHEDLEEYADTPSASSNRLLDFQIHLSAYIKLSLTNESDTLNAFAGVLQALAGNRYGPMFGLPPPALDQTILWIPCRDNKDEPMHLAVRNIPGITIPSWSWASIKGYRDISFPRNFAGTLVAWFQLDKTQTSFHRIDQAPGQWGKDRTVEWNSDLLQDHGRMEHELCCQGELYMVLALLAGCCEWAVPSDEYCLHVPLSFSDLRQEAAQRWPSYEDYLQEMAESAVAPLHHHQRLGQTNASVVGANWCGVLWCRAQSAFFNVTKAAEDGRLVIEDEERQYVGIFGVNEGEPNMKHVHIRLAAGEDRVKCEFIALSVCVRFAWKSYVQSPFIALDKLEVWDYWTDAMISAPENGLTFFDPEGNHLEYPAMVSVMAIGRDAEGFAFRMGVGEIFLTEWAKAERRFTDIALR